MRDDEVIGGGTSRGWRCGDGDAALQALNVWLCRRAPFVNRALHGPLKYQAAPGPKMAGNARPVLEV